MLLKRKAISNKFGSTWERSRFHKNFRCAWCSHICCDSPVLLNKGNTIGSFQDVCLKKNYLDTFYVFKLLKFNL